MQKRLITQIVAIGAAGALALSACSNGSSGGGGGLAASSSSGGGSNVTWKIGFEAPLSGDSQQTGLDELHGAQVAIDDANADSSLGFKVELVQADDGGTPDKAPAAAATLVPDAKVLGVVGPAFSGTTKAVGATYTQAGLAMVSPSATNSTLTSIGFTTFNRVVPPDSVQGTQVADYLAKVSPKVYLIDDASDYGKGLAGDITKELSAKGITPTTQSVPQGTKDFGTIAQAVASSGVGAMYYAGYYTDASLFAKALQSVGYKGLAMSGDGAKSDGFLTGAGDSGNGWKFSCPCTDANVDPNAKAFQAAYTKKFNGASGVYAAESYDSTMAVVKAIAAASKSGAPTRKAVADAVRASDFQGLTNKIKFTATGEIDTQKVNLFEVKSGKLNLVGDITTAS